MVVSYPPSRTRRRRFGRALAFAATGLLVIVASAGFVYWQKTRFPARSEMLAGTPVELRIQKGVSPRELKAIRRGLRTMQRYMKHTLGSTVTEHVEARVARQNSCRPFQSSAGGALMGEGDRGFLCVDTSSPAWQYLMRRDFTSATAVSAHEYVHVLQAELGCLHPSAYRWLIEGMATDLAWSALVHSRRTTQPRVVTEIRNDRPLGSGVGRLAAYERGDGRDQQYALWHLAVRMLVRRAAAARAAPPSAPEVSLVRFCKRVGAGQGWRAAFRRSFGLSVGDFYAAFARARRHPAPLYR